MPVTPGVHVDVAAEGGADVGVFAEGAFHGGVEAGAYAVVAVEQMDELAVGALEAGVEVGGVADVGGLAVEADAAGCEFVDHGLGVVGGGVVHDLDLHLSGPGSWARTEASVSRR